MSLMCRAFCKRCGAKNDREDEGNLGGLICSACTTTRHNQYDRERKARIVARLAYNGEKPCRACHNAAAIDDGRCAPCAARAATRNDKLHLSSTWGRNLAHCPRCHLRGEHECLQGAVRTSAWENMIGRRFR